MNKNNIIDYVKYIIGRELTSEESYRLDDMLNEFAKENQTQGARRARAESYSGGSWEFSGGI